MLGRFCRTQLTVLVTAVLAGLLPVAGADFSMKVTDKGYLDTQGFSIFLYDSTYHPVFVDQKNTAMEMILAWTSDRDQWRCATDAHS
jgi:endoglucanase